MQSVIGALRVNLGIDTAAFSDGLKTAEASLKRVGQSMRRVGKTLSLAVTTPLTGFAALSLRTAGSFEASMNQVAAVSGATGEQLIALRDVAKDLGATTQFSASQAADAMKFLSMAGFDAQQTMDALPGTLQLAASAAIDLGDAADIVSNILSGYGLQVEELSRVNDVLVKTFTASNTDLRQLGEAMKYAGPVANAAGVAFEEAAAAIGLMGNAGIQGSMAGTSLRGAISRILSPTNAAAGAMHELGLNFTDTQGRILPLADIIQQLAPYADDAGLFMELFGQRAGPAMAALVSQGSDSLRGLTSELQNAGGTAERIAEAQMQGFNGAMKELRSAFEALQIAIAESGLLDFMTQVVKSVSDVVRQVADADPKLLKFGTIFGVVAAAIGPALVALGLLATVVAAIGIPVAAAIAGIAALTAAVGAFWPEIRAIGETIRDAVVTAIEWVAALPDAFLEMKDRVVAHVREMVERIREWLLGRLGRIVDGVKDTTQQVGDFFRGLYDRVVGNSYVPDMVEGVETWMTRLERSMPPLAESATDSVAQAFDNMARSVGRSGAKMGDILRTLAVDLARVGINQGGRALIGAIFPAIAGARAAGGPVSARRSYLVGEQGPELFTPRAAGVITPNGGGGGGGQVTITLGPGLRAEMLDDAARQTVRIVDGATRGPGFASRVAAASRGAEKARL